MIKEKFTNEVSQSGFGIDKKMAREVHFSRGEMNGSTSSLRYYEILPGIDIVYNSFHSDQVSEVQYKNDGEQVIEINFCLEGCFQCILDGKVFSLEEGEIEAHLWGIPKRDAKFPRGEYRGVSLLVAPEKAVKNLMKCSPNLILICAIYWMVSNGMMELCG